MTGRTYQDLELWQRSMDLVVEMLSGYELFSGSRSLRPHEASSVRCCVSASEHR